MLVQSFVVFHMETVIWFALQIMSCFSIECYTLGSNGLKENINCQILNLSLPKCFQESFQQNLKFKPKFEAILDGDCDSEEIQLHTLPLMAQSSGIFSIALA